MKHDARHVLNVCRDINHSTSCIMLIRWFYLAVKLSLEGTNLMDGLISFGLGLLAFVSAFCLAGLARAMRNDKLPPNMWAGIRTKAALESESSWYRVQRAGSVPVICLATAYADSGLLFILQGIYHETISVLIPVIVFSVQSLVGIIWMYKASYNSDPSQNPE